MTGARGLPETSMTRGQQMPLHHDADTDSMPTADPDRLKDWVEYLARGNRAPARSPGSTC